MHLTPVRVRGKRKATTSNSTTTTTTVATASTPRPAKMLRSIKDVKQTRELRPRVNLDRLPAETLESILLYSGSVALPRASPIIGAKLSSRATLLRFFIWGFHDTWDQWFGIPFDAKIQGPKTKEESRVHGDIRKTSYLPCDGDPDLQSALLELPWVDVDFILRAQQTWADTYARHRFYKPSLDDSGFGTFDASLFFAHEYQHFARHPGMMSRTLARNVHPYVRLPLPLVTGPWDEEREKRLLWLVRGGINLGSENSPTGTLPWEYHLEFLRNAVVQAETPSSVVYRCLRGLCDLRGVPQDLLKRERDDLVKRLQWGQHSQETLYLLQEVLEDINYKLDSRSFDIGK